MKGRERKACSEKWESFKCSFIPEREWRQVKERALTPPSKIDNKDEGEGENDFVFFLGSRAATPRLEILGTK